MEALLHGSYIYLDSILELSLCREHYRLLHRQHTTALLLSCWIPVQAGYLLAAVYIRSGADVGRLPERRSLVRQRRLLFAGAVARQPEGQQLPKRLMFGEVEGRQSP